MYLGIEIGGTKLQLGVGAGDGSELTALERRSVDPRRGASGILEQIETAAGSLIQRHSIERIGIGFGGPVDASGGRVIRSHQIDGWDDVRLAGWCEQTFGLPTVLANDCDAAALAEARFGAGRDAHTVFYTTVGTGIGGGLVVGGRLHGVRRPAASEIGHLRPGLHEDRPEATVESLASGWGIAVAARSRLSGEVAHRLQIVRGADAPGDPEEIRQRLLDAEEATEEYLADLLQRCDAEPERITAKMVAQAASEGNQVACDVLQHAVGVLGWAVAQMITLLAPEVVVVGGGVSLIGEQLFFAPLRKHVARFVFPPLLNSYQIIPAALGEAVVVHGALALAAERER